MNRQLSTSISRKRPPENTRGEVDRACCAATDLQGSTKRLDLQKFRFGICDPHDIADLLADQRSRQGRDVGDGPSARIRLLLAELDLCPRKPAFPPNYGLRAHGGGTRSLAGRVPPRRGMR
jgi:hypothetical protein